MKKSSLILLGIILFHSIQVYALGTIGSVAKTRDGKPLIIGMILKTTDDEFFNETIRKLEKKSIKEGSKILTRYTSDNGQEQLYELERLYFIYGISSLIIEVADNDTMEFVNDFCIKNKIAILYINEDSEIDKVNIPENRRIASYTFSREYSKYQLEFAASYFSENNIKDGTILLLYNNNDPAQDKQAKIIIDTFSRNTNRFNIYYASVDNFQEALSTMNYWLSNSKNIIPAVFTTNNTLAEWASISIKNYKSSISDKTGKRARRSERRSRIANQSVISKYRTKYRLTSGNPKLNSIENIIVLGNNINSNLFPFIDDGSLNMAIFRNSNVYSDEILKKIVLLSQGKNLSHIEEYYPNIITSSNIFRFSREIDEIIAKEASLKNQEAR